MRVIRYVAIGLGIAAVCLGAWALYVQADGIPQYPPITLEKHIEVTPERVAQGKRIAGMLCIGCHLNPATGQLTGKVLPDLPSLFGVVSSRNITQDREFGIGTWTDGDIWVLLRTGLTPTGRYVPPYMVKLPLAADEDLAALIAFLRSSDPLVQPAHVDEPPQRPSFVTKALTHTLMKPLPLDTTPIVAPPMEDAVARGAYYVKGLTSCFSCHSGDLTQVHELEPERSAGYLAGGAEMLDANGHPITAPNLTLDKTTGIGAWTESQFVTAVREGVTPDGRILTYPMLRYSEFTEADAKAIYAYLKTVPPVVHATPPPFDYGTLHASNAGEQVYNKYGCVACHGVTGIGLYDLTQADRKYARDADIAAWIRNPAKFVPATKMPPWEGVISEAEFAPLIDYVRLLGKRAHPNGV